MALIFDALVDRLEWRGTIYLGLELAPEQVVGFKLIPYGAERAHFPLVECMPWPWMHNEGKLIRPPAGSAPLEPFAMRVRLSWTPEDQRWRCSLALPEDDEELSVPLEAGPPQEMALKLMDHGAIGDWTSLRVDRLELWGVEPLGAPLDPRQQASLALLRQDPAAALALLPADALVERAVAQTALRRPFDAMKTFARALREDRARLTPRLPYLLRGHRETMAPLLRAASGPEWPALFKATYERPILGNLPVPDIEEALRAELEDVALPRDPDDPAWWLMAQRVGALLRGPDPARGRAAAAQWLLAFEALRLPRDHDRAYTASSVHFELALAAAAAGDLETAEREAQAAVDRSPTPVVAPDRFAVSQVWKKAGLPLPVGRPWD